MTKLCVEHLGFTFLEHPVYITALNSKDASTFIIYLLLANLTCYFNFPIDYK